MVLDTGKFDAKVKDNKGRSPLSRAADRGHEAVVWMLLDTNMVGVESEDRDSPTPLLLAAERGRKAVVRLLQPTSQPISSQNFSFSKVFRADFNSLSRIFPNFGSNLIYHLELIKRCYPLRRAIVKVV